MEISRGTTGAASNRGWHIVRIAVALVLFVAAATKCHQCCTGPIPGSGLFSAKWFVIGLVEAEWLGTVVLLLCLLPRPAWAISLACFSVFALVSLGKGLMGEASCGCFGGLIQVNPFLTATLDVALVVSLLRWRPKRSFFSIRRAMAVTTVWALIGIPAAYAMANYTEATLSDAGTISGDGKFVVLKPEKWIGKRFPLLNHIDTSGTLKKGKWLLLLYRHDCSDCQAFFPRYERLARELAIRGETMQVALIEVPPYGSDQFRTISPGIPCLIGHLSDTRNWHVMTPLVVVLDEAVVTRVGDGKELVVSIMVGRLGLGKTT